MANKSFYNPVPLAHLDKKQVEMIVAAGAVRKGELSKTAFELAYKIRPDDAERDLIMEANDRVDRSYIHPTDGENLTDSGNAIRFARQHGEVVRYCHERGAWLVWSGKRWEWDRSGIAITLAKRTVRSIYGECEREPDKKRREALGEHARKSENDARIRALLHLAQSEVPVRLDELDRNPFLLNCQNGIIDLETGELMPHEPERMLTKICPVEFDAQARCKRFLAFLNQIIMSNQSLIGFLQAWFGYCLTADVSEHAVSFFHGAGANGKSTLIEIVRFVMGDYASTAAPGLLMMKRNEQHPTEIADLLGKRLVTTVETQEGRKFNESVFKWLSGGDRLKARFMKQDFFEFEATHKFTIAANHKPLVTDITESFWRRLKLVPFNVQIAKVNQDKRLLEKLKSESPGILAWLVRGAIQWRKDGLPEPPEITAAVDVYRDEQDFLAPFLHEYCEIATNEDAEAQVGVLYRRYVQWTEENGEKQMSSKKLSTMMKQRGYENYPRTNDKKFYWKELALKK
jgi:putative DNA primase/helicase